MTEQQPADAQPSEAGPATAGPGAEPAADPSPHPFADLEHRPVTEHVAVYETEHARLQQELSSIDQL